MPLGLAEAAELEDVDAAAVLGAPVVAAAVPFLGAVIPVELPAEPTAEVKAEAALEVLEPDWAAARPTMAKRKAIEKRILARGCCSGSGQSAGVEGVIENVEMI